jgi:hypothetical protein
LLADLLVFLRRCHVAFDDKNAPRHQPLLPGFPPSPCPELLTEEEAIRYLRLDTIGGLRNPKETLARYRSNGLLRGTQVSKKIFYRRVELDRFLDRLTAENPR